MTIKAKGEVASYHPSVFVHSFTAGMPVRTDNCCFQLETNIWLFIYGSQQGSHPALDLHEARAQDLSDLCWTQAQ